MKKIIIGVIIIVVLIGVAIYLYPSAEPPQPAATATSALELTKLPNISSDTSAFFAMGFPATSTTITDIRQAPYNFTTVSVSVGNTNLNFIQPTKIVSIPLSKEDASQWMGIDENRNEYFAYQGRSYNDQHIQTSGGGTSGEQFQDTYSVQNSDGSWRNLFTFTNDDDRFIIGYGNDLIFVNRASLPSSASGVEFIGGVGLFDSQNDETSTISTDYFSSSADTDTSPGMNDIGPNGIVIASGTLSIEVGSDYCFWIKTGGDITYGVEGDNIFETTPNEALYGGCANGFYSIKNNSLIQNDAAFQPFYMKTAAQYQSNLSSTNADWLSPLIGRTLQLIFAGATSTARESLTDDFNVLSQLHPNADYTGIDPNLIQQKIQEQLQ